MSTKQMRPFFEEVRTHYDQSNEFFGLFLDPTMTYSCAYFERDDMSLEEAQRAKLDLALGKLDLQPGHQLLDVGCGWGSCLRRAAEGYGVHAVGVTLSENQNRYIQEQLAARPVNRGSVDVRVCGWEEFDEPVDRIVSIGAFEHFKIRRHVDFFKQCKRLLPPDGRLLLHTICMYRMSNLDKMGIKMEHEDVLFGKFIAKEIFPGGELDDPAYLVRRAEEGGLRVTRQQSLQSHYVRTLDTWTEALQANRDDAIELMSEEVYNRYIKYLTGCSQRFHKGIIDVIQFTCVPH